MQPIEKEPAAPHCLVVITNVSGGIRWSVSVACSVASLSASHPPIAYFMLYYLPPSFLLSLPVFPADPFVLLLKEKEGNHKDYE